MNLMNEQLLVCARIKLSNFLLDNATNILNIAYLEVKDEPDETMEEKISDDTILNVYFHGMAIIRQLDRLKEVLREDVTWLNYDNLRETFFKLWGEKRNEFFNIDAPFEFLEMEAKKIAEETESPDFLASWAESVINTKDALELTDNENRQEQLNNILVWVRKRPVHFLGTYPTACIRWFIGGDESKMVKTLARTPFLGYNNLEGMTISRAREILSNMVHDESIPDIFVEKLIEDWI